MNVYTFKRIPKIAYTTLAAMFQQEFTHPNFKHLMEFLFSIHIWFWHVAHAQQKFFCLQQKTGCCLSYARQVLPLVADTCVNIHI